MTYLENHHYTQINSNQVRSVAAANTRNKSTQVGSASVAVEHQICLLLFYLIINTEIHREKQTVFYKHIF